MIRILAASLATILACSSVAAQDRTPPRWSSGRDASWAPFAPRASPDHVVVMVDNMRNERRVVSRHGTWARVEASDLHGSAVYLVNLAAPVAVSFKRAEDGRYAYLYVTVAGGGPSDNGPVRLTGQTDRLLGETCAVWDITSRVMSTSSDGRWLSCVTNDGIELWHRYEGAEGRYRHEMRAISVTRTPVAAETVTPPRDLLDPRRWAIDWPPAPAPGISIRLDGGGSDAAKNAKHYSRLGDIVRFDEPRQITVRNRSTKTFAAFRRDAEGRYESLTMSALHPEIEFGPPEPANRPELSPLNIDGVSCAWSFMTPGVSDYARFECLTTEGDLLAELVRSRGGGSSVTAREIRRSALSPADVMLPPEVLDPDNWALR